VKKYLLGSVAAGLLGSGVTPAQVVNEFNLNNDLGIRTNLTPAVDGGSLIIEAKGVLPKAPLFYKAVTKQDVTVDAKSIHQVVTIEYTKLQGEDEVMSLQINNKSEIKSVVGTGLKEWSIRELDGVSYLDVKVKDKKTKNLKVTVTAEFKLDDKNHKPVVGLMTFSPVGQSAGYHETITVKKSGVHVNVTKAQGTIMAKTDDKEQLVFLSDGISQLELSIFKNESDYAAVDLRDVRMRATVDSNGESALVRLTGNLNVRRVDDKPFTLVQGKVGLTTLPEIEAGKVRVTYMNEGIHKGGMGVALVCEKEGEFPLDIEFAVPIHSGTGWNKMQFTVPNGAVVPIEIASLDEQIDFQQGDAGDTANDFLRAMFKDELWQGVLPASGLCNIQWKRKAKRDGELFYTSHGLSEISIGSGLMHNSSLISFKVLQGKIDTLTFDLSGAGEIVSVFGNQVATWKVNEIEGKRVLECVLKNETDKVDAIRVASQFPLGKFPAKVEPLSLTPKNSMRHDGFVRVTNKGAVRVETSLTEGLMQLSPDKFPVVKNIKPPVLGNQIFVYRYPSADRKLEVAADQVISEVAVSHITTYEMSETDRVISADIEIDITEASLREWSFMIPEDYSVSNVVSANMVDHVVSNTIVNGRRALKVLFNQEVLGRQLIQVRLEKNVPAGEGDWSLATLLFPEAKRIKGDIGVLSASGWKMNLTGESFKNLDVRPLAYFPKKNMPVEQLQHAFRTRSADWSASFKIVAMGQSVQSDLLHLYHLGEGVLEAKVLVYYFVVGAPANEWKVQIPASAENVSVEGQNVRTWDTEGDVLTVTLNQPVLGAAKLLVTYEEPMSPNGGMINMGAVKPLEVDSESGFIHLVTSQQVQSEVISKGESLLKISPLEMPSEHQVLSSLPSVAAWQYASRPCNVQLSVKTLELVKTLNQAVGAASLKTRITRAGEVVTNATFLVNTRGKKAIRMQLPEGNTLWTAKADGVLINARVDGNELILPLPPTQDPNRYRSLEVRYGGTAENPSKVTVGPPVLSAPMTVAEWKVVGDNHLTPIGGNVKPLEMAVTMNGFDQVSKGFRYLAGVLFLLLGGVFLIHEKIKDKWLTLFGNIWLVAALLLALVFMVGSYDTHVDSLKEFNVVAPVVSDQQSVFLELRNDESAPSSLSAMGIILSLAGLGLFVAGLIRKEVSKSIFKSLALLLILLGCLMHVGGASYLYFILALIAAMLLIKGLPKLKNFDWKVKLKKTAAKASSVTSLIVLGCLASVHDVQAADQINTADSIVETWKISDDTIKGNQQIIWSAEEGESLEILRAPAVLLAAKGEGFRVVKVRADEEGNRVGKIYWKLVAEETGELRVNVDYELFIKQLAELQLMVPSGRAAMKSIKVEVDQPNWEISSPQATRTTELIAFGGGSAVELTLMGVRRARVAIKPMTRDRSKETLKFLAEVANVYVPAPGVLDGRHKVKIKPLEGEVKELSVEIPEGVLIGSVEYSSIDNWRFDANSKLLTITMKRPLVHDFELTIETQRGIKSFPQDLVLEPIQVQGAATTVGVIGYGFGEDSQPDNAKVTNLLEINITDFDVGLIKQARSVQPKFVLHKAYRYVKDSGKIELRVAAVSPEVRVESQQVVRLTDERISVQVDAQVAITRAGLFELKFYVPDGLSVESINGSALRDWNVAEVKGRKLATMFLNGKTMGSQLFSITMLGDAPDFSESTSVWDAPSWVLEDVSRQSGVLNLIPDHGIRLRVADRKHASQVDSAKTNNQKNKGALAFRLLQKDWKISLNLQQLDPWITAEMLQQVSIREGLTKHWVNIEYNVDHVPIELLDTKQTVHYAVVRVPSRLEVTASELREWRDFDWSNVPNKLKNPAERSEPSLCYRVVDANKSMDLSVKRHSMADTLKLRVQSGEMRTMFNAEGSTLSRLSLAVNVVEKSNLKVSLPAGAELFNVIVNGKSTEVVKEDSAGNVYWFLVGEAVKGNELANVMITYEIESTEASGGAITLLGPTLNIPLENIDWYVMLPDGYNMNDFKGSFDYLDTIVNDDLDSYVDAFREIKEARYNKLRKEGQRELDQAMSWSNSGEIQKANEALYNVISNSAIDAASYEDARVKLEHNMTSQAIMGLNTRSQKSYMDNKAMGNTQRANGALEEAASRNPFLEGKKEFNPNQLNDLIQGNTAEEIEAMQRIAKKLVQPQLVSTNAEQVVDLEILTTRNMVHFHKDVHLAADKDLKMQIELKRNQSAEVSDQSGPSSFGVILLLAVFSILGVWLIKR